MKIFEIMKLALERVSLGVDLSKVLSKLERGRNWLYECLGSKGNNSSGPESQERKGLRDSLIE